MNRTGTALCIAAALGFAVTLGAQSSTTRKTNRSTTARSKARNDITIAGCLAKDARGNYMLTNARMEPAGSVSGTTGTAPTTDKAASSTTTKAATSTAAKSASSTATAGDTNAAVTVETWRLNGNASDLDRHVGHKVRVIGRADDSARTSTAAADTVEHPPSSTAKPATTTTGKTATATAAEHSLDVRTVTMLSPTCP